MEYDFQRYLRAKRSVDDRALNRVVWQALVERLAGLEGRPSIEVLELGGGIGTMFERMAEWGALTRAEYTLVDAEADNIRCARRRLLDWAAYQRLEIQEGDQGLFFHGADQAFLVYLRAEDVRDFFTDESGRRQWDLIVAHAFLDLMDVPRILPEIKTLTRAGGLLYLTINFDGMSAFEPVADEALEEKILGLYHRSMDTRRTDGLPSGASRTGRRMFHWLQQAGLRILAAGSSDWVVYPTEGSYPGDEAYFLHFILHFFEQTLGEAGELGQSELAGWLAERRRQIEAGELVYIAHQIDFLVQAG